jgi:hypothetical protein
MAEIRGFPDTKPLHPSDFLGRSGFQPNRRKTAFFRNIFPFLGGAPAAFADPAKPKIFISREININ